MLQGKKVSWDDTMTVMTSGATNMAGCQSLLMRSYCLVIFVVEKDLRSNSSSMPTWVNHDGSIGLTGVGL